MGLAGTTAAGGWFSLSEQAGARFVRQAIQETTRKILPSPNKPQPLTWSDREITAATAGHATVLVNFYGLTILTDPALCSRVGADIGVATVGPKRLVHPPLSFGELPPIDLVLLSHAHMDHFDLPTLQKFSSAPKAVSARSTLGSVSSVKFRSNVTELGWGESAKISTRQGDVRLEALRSATGARGGVTTGIEDSTGIFSNGRAGKSCLGATRRSRTSSKPFAARAG